MSKEMTAAPDHAPDTASERLLIKPLVLRHAEDAAFYWMQGTSNTHSPLLHFDRLRHFDRLLRAHLDGLRAAGDVGWECALRNLQRWRRAGEAFVAYVLAVEAGDKMRLQALWEVVEKNPDAMQPGIVSALAWIEEETAVLWMDFWLTLTSHPRLQQIALLAFSARRLLPDVSLKDFFDAPDAATRQAICTLVGNLRLTQYIRQVQAACKDAEQDVREAATIASLLLLQGEVTLPGLWQASLHWNAVANNNKGATRTAANERAETIARYFGHVLPPEHPSMRELMERIPPRQGLIVLAHQGDPATIPSVITGMGRKELARLAGWCFSMITGVDLDLHQLAAAAPEADETEDERAVPLKDPDLGLPWPHPAMVDAWWREHGKHYAGGVRLLLGKSADDPANCFDVLNSGAQAARWAAAMNLAMQHVNYPLIAINARFSAQRAQMATLVEDE